MVEDLQPDFLTEVPVFSVNFHLIVALIQNLQRRNLGILKEKIM